MSIVLQSGILRARGALLVPAAVNLLLSKTAPDVALSGGYDNVNNWPSAANRPTFNSGTNVLTWIGPVGGGPSTTSDSVQNSTLTNATAASIGTITTNGTVISDKNITGTLTINANDCTVKRCRFSASGIYAIQFGDGQSGNVVEDCILESPDDFSIRTGGNSAGATTFMRRLNISLFEDGLGPIAGGGGGVTVIDNWIHDLANVSPNHTDGTSFDDSGADVLIQHNYVDLGSDKSNTAGGISATNLGGDVTNYRVINNFIIGGSNCILLDGNFGGGGTITDTLIENNFLRLAGGGGYSLRRGDTGTTISGNVDADTLANIDASI